MGTVLKCPTVQKKKKKNRAIKFLICMVVKWKLCARKKKQHELKEPSHQSQVADGQVDVEEANEQEAQRDSNCV